MSPLKDKNCGSLDMGGDQWFSVPSAMRLRNCGMLVVALVVVRAEVVDPLGELTVAALSSGRVLCRRWRPKIEY